MRPTGADIPPELFQFLLEHILLRADPLISRRDREFAEAVAESKRVLGTFALVSTYFARICRPRLFQGVLLRNVDDLQGCLALIKHSSPSLPSIATFIRKVKVEVRSRDKPWLHLVKTGLLPRVSGFALILLTVDASYFYPNLPVRTIQQGLPRTIPRVFSYLSHLTLQNMHFQSGRECVRLITELPLVTSLRLEHVTWESPPEQMSFRRVNKGLAYILVVEQTPQIFPWFLVALVTHQWTPSRPRRDGAVLTPAWVTREHDPVSMIYHAFLPSEPQAPLYATASRTYQDYDLVELQNADEEPILDVEVIIDARTSVLDTGTTFMPETTLTFGRPKFASGDIHLVSICFDFCSIETESLVLQSVWKKFVEHASLFRHLGEIRFLFPALVPLRQFLLNNHQVLAPLRSADSRRVAYYYREVTDDYPRQRWANADAVLKTETPSPRH